jgi:menaquinone-dependent protoporphyrinogen oxidase
MPNQVLVTYATRTGATAGVAEAIAKTLAENGVQVQLLPIQQVTDLSSYRAVVAGSAIQGSNWLPEAMEFVRAHRAELAQRPFAAFLVCMTMAMATGDYREHVQTFMQPVRALVRPVSEGYFAGVLDIGKVPSWRDRLGFRISVALGVWKEGDHRDWDAIHTWAIQLKPLLVV